MTASLRTQLRAAQYDQQRLESGIEDNLFLCAATPSNGTEPIAEIDSGWSIQKEEDRIAGTQFIAVRIVETDVNQEKLTASIMRKVCSLLIGQRRYNIDNKVDPFEEPRMWLIQCNPTGEVVASDS